jgi:hypothetical protein
VADHGIERDLVDWNPGLAIESYTRGAPDDFRKGWGVKTLFRPVPRFPLRHSPPDREGRRPRPRQSARN